MGWISNRFAQNRYKWGRPVSEEKRRAPLRAIVVVLRGREGLFDTDWVELECGHRTSAYGDHKARCVDCLRASDAGGGTAGGRAGD